jgi:hypothetical protein
MPRSWALFSNTSPSPHWTHLELSRHKSQALEPVQIIPQQKHAAENGRSSKLGTRLGHVSNSAGIGGWSHHSGNASDPPAIWFPKLKSPKGNARAVA